MPFFCWLLLDLHTARVLTSVRTCVLAKHVLSVFPVSVKKNYIYKKTTVVHYTRIHISNARSKRLFAHPGGRVVPTFFYGRVPP